MFIKTLITKNIAVSTIVILWTLDAIAKFYAYNYGYYILNLTGVNLVVFPLLPVIIFALIYFQKTVVNKTLACFSGCLLIAGMLGNSIETLFYGKVVDFIPMIVNDTYFNFADVYLTLGILLIMITYLSTIRKWFFTS